MADPLFEFDPTSEDAANSPLSIWNTASYAVTAFNAPAPPLAVQWASSVDTEGSAAASRKHENRQISITVEVLSASALRSLQAKVAKIAREGGTAKLTLPASGEVVIFDLLAADTFEPQFDVVYFTNTGAFCVVNLTLTAKPYGRGAEVTLSASTATALAPLVFTKTGIAGDIPATGRLNISNTTTDKTTAIWGFQSRYYSAASTAALLYEAESGVALSASAHAGPGGASGGGANKTMRDTAVGTSPANAYEIATSQTLTHIGSFRVYARVYVASGTAGVVSVAANWSPSPSVANIQNDYVSVVDASGSAIADTWVLLDLGLVTFPPPFQGSNAGSLFLSHQRTAGTTTVYYDWVALVPVDEGYGVATDDVTTIDSAWDIEITDKGAFITTGSQWWRAAQYEGDYLRVPVAGAEARTLRGFVMLAGEPASSVGPGVVYSGDLEAIQATLTYTPRFLVVPTP